MNHLLNLLVAFATSSAPVAAPEPRGAAIAPQPLIARNHPVDWWFAFKFNTGTLPKCPGRLDRSCVFGGTPRLKDSLRFSLQYAVASSENPALSMGSTCLGEDTLVDPLGTTFGQLYNGGYNYVLWNDQFYDDPAIPGCSKFCGGPWGHSKGAVAWNDSGEGFVLQVTTPSWPASGSSLHPRADGNTLGCVSNDNNVLVSQHFFALALRKDDLPKVLKALRNASVVTDTGNVQIFRNGGPEGVRSLAATLGVQSLDSVPTLDTLSTGVILISKPSALHVPPWQMVSALLESVPLRVATWWQSSTIPTTTARTTVGCWDAGLGHPGGVQIATSGTWNGDSIGLKGGANINGNHAKIGVSTRKTAPLVIFGDMNQEGSLSGPDCSIKQNGRGGLFYVVSDSGLNGSVRSLLKGSTAPKADTSSSSRRDRSSRR